MAIRPDEHPASFVQASDSLVMQCLDPQRHAKPLRRELQAFIIIIRSIEAQQDHVLTE
jgi:hypothetical protein